MISIGDESTDRPELKSLEKQLIDTKVKNLLSESGYLTFDGLISG